jgi:hypothetical protein
MECPRPRRAGNVESKGSLIYFILDLTPYRQWFQMSALVGNVQRPMSKSRKTPEFLSPFGVGHWTLEIQTRNEAKSSNKSYIFHSNKNRLSKKSTCNAGNVQRPISNIQFRNQGRHLNFYRHSELDIGNSNSERGEIFKKVAHFHRGQNQGALNLFYSRSYSLSAMVSKPLISCNNFTAYRRSFFSTLKSQRVCTGDRSLSDLWQQKRRRVLPAQYPMFR